MPRKISAVTQQRIDDAFSRGKEIGRQLTIQEIQESKQNAFSVEKLKSIQAVTELIEANTKAMSRAGYLLAQLNKEKGW